MAALAYLVMQINMLLLYAAAFLIVAIFRIPGALHRRFSRSGRARARARRSPNSF